MRPPTWTASSSGATVWVEEEGRGFTTTTGPSGRSPDHLLGVTRRPVPHPVLGAPPSGRRDTRRIAWFSTIPGPAPRLARRHTCPFGQCTSLPVGEPGYHRGLRPSQGRLRHPHRTGRGTDLRPARLTTPAARPTGGGPVSVAPFHRGPWPDGDAPGAPSPLRHPSTRPAPANHPACRGGEKRCRMFGRAQGERTVRCTRRKGVCA